MKLIKKIIQIPILRVPNGEKTLRMRFWFSANQLKFLLNQTRKMRNNNFFSLNFQYSIGNNDTIFLSLNKYLSGDTKQEFFQLILNRKK